MGGKFSRNKGRRGEQQLVLSLAGHGFKAERVLRQYQEAGQPDVIATKGGLTYTFELKCRLDSFKSLYDLYMNEKPPGGVLAVTGPLGSFAMSTLVIKLTHPEEEHVFRNLEKYPIMAARRKRALDRVFKLKEVKQTADYLVLKDNNKPRIYIRYW